MSFWEATIVGLGLGASLAAPPGPIMAKMAFETARGRWPQAVWVGLGATSADMTFFLLVWQGVLRLLPSPTVLGVLSLFGVALMDWFAYEAWRAARQPLAAPRSRLNGFPAGYVIAITSPFNLAWWLTSGTPFIHLYGPPLALGFAAALVGVVLLSVWVFHYGSRKVMRFETYVSYASAVLLFGFGLFLAYKGLGFLGFDAAPG